MTRCRRLLLLGFVTSLLAACTAGSDEPIEVETPRLSHEEAKAQVPLHGDDRRPLIWRVDSFSDPDAAEAAEAAQYFFVVFEVLGRAKRPVDAAYLKLLSHFSTDEWLMKCGAGIPLLTGHPRIHLLIEPAHAGCGS